VKGSGVALEPDAGPVTETVTEPPAGGVAVGTGVGTGVGTAPEMVTACSVLTPLTVSLSLHDAHAVAGVHGTAVLASPEELDQSAVPPAEMSSHRAPGWGVTGKLSESERL
jgi:hypothetical protein